MKLTISRDILLDQLSNVIGAIEKKHTKKILENIYISMQDDVLHVVGTDLEIELSSQTQIICEEQGTITTTAWKILEICKALPTDSFIVLETDDHRLYLRANRSNFELSTLPADEYPLLDDISFSDEIIIRENVLKGLLNATAFSMANQDVRYYLNGLLLAVSDGLVKAVTTDGHRLAISAYQRDDNNGSDIEKSIIIPRKGVLELSRILDASSEIPLALYLSDNHIRIQKEDIRFTSKLIDGKYPDYQAAIPASSTYQIELERILFKDTLSRVAILSNEKFRGIRLSFDKGVMKLHSTNPEKESATEEIDIEYSGELLEIGFNVSYLLDAINHIKADTIILHLSNPDSSVLITTGGVESDSLATKYVVMPIRL
ncbi:MAG: DNA polymerase III subunit beta [Cocleimonas sp.]|nr:DNA polymerase III subunit beta [Cocleimonas sp.]